MKHRVTTARHTHTVIVHICRSRFHQHSSNHEFTVAIGNNSEGVGVLIQTKVFTAFYDCVGHSVCLTSRCARMKMVQVAQTEFVTHCSYKISDKLQYITKQTHYCSLCKKVQVQPVWVMAKQSLLLCAINADITVLFFWEANCKQQHEHIITFEVHIGK